MNIFFLYIIKYLFILQKESRTDVQFHLAALRGDAERLRQILDTGKIHVDSRDKVQNFENPQNFIFINL